MKAPKSGGKNFPITKAGSYLAVCYAVCDLGTHEESFKGKERDRRLCLITFEIPGERIEIEKEDGTKEADLGLGYQILIGFLGVLGLLVLMFMFWAAK